MIDYSSTTRSKVKNLTVSGYCSLCKKPTSWNGTLVMGNALEEGAQEVPEVCGCQWDVAIPANGYSYGVQAISALQPSITHIMVNKQEYTALVAENQQLRARIAELEASAVRNAVDDLFLPDEVQHDTATEQA